MSALLCRRRACGGVVLLLTLLGLGPVAGAAVESSAIAPAVAAGGSSCLPQRRVDLAELISAQPLLPRQGGGQMVPVTRGSPRWMAAFNAVLAWQNDDCPAFANFAERLGYQALEVVDSSTGSHHWVMLERSGSSGSGQRWNGTFVFRAPAERKKARRLIINAPHLGFDFSDDRAVKLYRELGATVLLQNSAHRCNLEACSGCGSFPGYVCGGCARSSDAAHSVDNLLFALFAALEGTRSQAGEPGWLHFEYHGLAARPAATSCAAIAQLSQGSSAQLSPAKDDGTYPNRFWKGLEKRLPPACVCYHQRERGCLLPGNHSVFGRLVNQESSGPFDPCTQEATRLAGRYLHFEWYQVPLPVVAAALSEAVPLP